MMLQTIQITCDFRNIQCFIWRLWRTPVKQRLSRSLRFYLHLAEGWATVVAVLRFQYAVTYFAESFEPPSGTPGHNLACSLTSLLRTEVCLGLENSQTPLSHLHQATH
jgi:hypothetical protein